MSETTHREVSVSQSTPFGSAMKFFIPITAKGEKIDLPLQFLPFKFNCVWPLAYNSPRYQLYIVNCLAVIGLGCYAGTIYAEYLFITEHEGEIAKIAECLCTTFVGTQFSIRILHLILCRHQMRDVMQKFYTKIYVHRSENEKIHKKCERSMRLLYVMTSSFILPLIFIYLGAMIVIARDPSSRSKPYFYRMQFAYDAQEPWLYAITSLYTGWVGFSSVTVMACEDCFIGITLSYCAVRYEILHKELDELYEKSVKSLARRPYPHMPNELHAIFHHKLRFIIRKQQMLDRFSEELQDFLGITIFILVTFGVFLLCVVAFQLAKTDFSIATFQYFSWLVSQSLEFLVIGSFGQRYTDAAAQMANSYYMCNWESLLAHGDAKANAQLIKDISFAIYRSQKSVHLNGMNFLILSLNSIGSALSSSVSYFMFLNTMEDITNKRNANK